MTSIIPFYLHNKKNILEYNCFSNFYKLPDYEYELPEFVQNENMPKKIKCNCSEKAIMACKALLMNDDDTFYKIIMAKEPKLIKAYGRTVKNFDNDKWLQYVEAIAYDIVYQKFKKNEYIQKILLSTEDAILVEASPYDKLWGVGLSINNDDIYDNEKWNGANILGYALMKVRAQLRKELIINDDNN